MRLIGYGVDRLPVTRLADLPAQPLGVMLPDRLLPDLMRTDPLTWEWPYACHRHGHVWIDGSERCTQCRAPFAEFGPQMLGQEALIAVTSSKRLDGQVAIHPDQLAP